MRTQAKICKGDLLRWFSEGIRDDEPIPEEYTSRAWWIYDSVSFAIGDQETASWFRKIVVPTINYHFFSKEVSNV